MRYRKDVKGLKATELDHHLASLMPQHEVAK